MDWESVKFFLAVAREGSLAGGGRVLGVKHSTVLRRIAALEAELGLTLFDRTPNGCLLTAAGREMMATAVAVDEEMVGMERRLSGRDLRLHGTVRLATIGVMVPWIAAALAELRQIHPLIRVEVAISPTSVSLARHEADIALRLSRNPPESLVGRRLATLAYGIYAAADHPAALRRDDDLAAQDWISYADSRAEVPQAQWVAANVPDDRIVMRANHTGMIVAAVAAGIGLGVLPCYLGDADPGLVRLRPLALAGHDLWILTHGDLRRTPRVRAVMDFLAKALSRKRSLIEGALEQNGE